MKNSCFHLNRKVWLSAVMLLVAFLPALAQKITVHGLVVDNLGEPLIGATVMEKGTSNGTATDIDGNFQITVDPKATLTVSYIGYDPQEIAVNGQTNLKITMSENSTTLKDVVVIGYGSVKKSDATGSVAMVVPDEVDANIATSAQDLLTGASPGVVVTSGGGSPEGGATIRIRGGASLNASNDPLIVLDGVPLSNDDISGMSNPLAMIAPDNIESMTILKDASATAIYGSRASNGVIIITTKRGKSGRPQVNFSANVSVNTARKTWNALDANAFTKMIKSYWGEDSEAFAALGGANTDWQKEILRTSVSHEYNLSVGGKAGFLPYRVSGSYTMNNGILKNSQMQRVTAGFNLTPEFFGGLLKVQANVKGYYIRNRFTDESCTSTALVADPTRPVYSYWKNENPETMGRFPYLYNGYSISASDRNINQQGVMNPVAQNQDPDNTADIYRSNGNLQIDYALHFLPDLHLNLNLGYDVTKSNNNIFIAENSPSNWNNKDIRGGAGTHYHSYELRRNTLLDFYINYKKEFEAIESYLDVMAGYSWQRFDSHGNNNGTVFTTNGFFAPNTQGGNLVPIVYDPDAPAGTTDDQVGKSIKPAYYWSSGRLQLISFFGRLNYTFKDTYLLTFTLRDDGTSRFSKNNRWGLFPSVALGWKINNMAFMESVRDNMNEFKLRLGWGQTGQQSVGGFFDYMGRYTMSQQGSWYPNMYNGTYGYYDNEGKFITPDSPVYYPNAYNPDLKWENTTTWNVGLDMGWWNNRLTVALDWYLRQSKDLLAEVPVAPGATTTNQMVKNIGDLENIGLEATIGARVFDTPDFVWNTSLNVAWNKNKITKLNDSNDDDFLLPVGGISGGTGNNCQAHKVGYPAFTFRLYEQIYDENGDPIEGAYVDQNGDGIINELDLVMKHSPDPKVTMTWTNNFSYKNWDFSFSLRANIGNYIYNDVRATRTARNMTWQNSALRNLVDSDFYFDAPQYFSDYYLENAGFVRCDNITVGYTWPSLLKDSLRLRLYGAVQNPFVITKYKGIDPEIYGGIDRSTYPRPVSFTLGLIATF